MYETQLYVSCHMGVYRHAYIRVCSAEVRGYNLFLGKSVCTIFLIPNLLIRAGQSFVRHGTFWKVLLFSEIVSETSQSLQLSYRHSQRGHKTQMQSRRLMSVKTKGQNHRSPESQPCLPYSIPNESNHSSSEHSSRALDPSGLSACTTGPHPSSRVRSSSDGWLLGDER